MNVVFPLQFYKKQKNKFLIIHVLDLNKERLLTLKLNSIQIGRIFSSHCRFFCLLVFPLAVE